jgi:hypothetical protein
MLLLICWAGLVNGCVWGLTEWSGRDPGKTVLREGDRPEEHGMGFGRAEWVGRGDGSADVVGFGFHPMEHLKVKRVGHHEPNVEVQSKWFHLRLKGVEAEMEVRLEVMFGEERPPQRRIDIYRGRAEVLKVVREKEVLRVETAKVELKGEEGKKMVVSGSVVAKRISEEEMERVMGKYREGMGMWEKE